MKRVQLNMSLETDEADLISEAARACHKSAASFAREVAVGCAEELLRLTEKVEL